MKIQTLNQNNYTNKRNIGMKIQTLNKFNYLEILPRLGEITEIGYVNLDYMDLEELPNMEHIKVNNYFTCSINKLISLKGCPYYIGGDFWCYNNKLASLNYLPSYIGSNFWGINNTLPCLDYIYDKMKKSKLGFNELSEKLILEGDITILDNIFKSSDLQRIYRNILIKEILE